MKYVKGNLFSAPYGEVLCHSCNTLGKWGAGIAVGFKNKYPEAFQLYVEKCMIGSQNILGTSQVVAVNGHVIANLFVSVGYGWAKDPQDDILISTQNALIHLADQIRPMRLKVNMPKINSGLFAVPWEKTEDLIKMYLEPSTAGIVVWELEQP